MSKIITLDRLSGFLTNLKGLFVTKTDAESTYETKANAANIYETKEDAATHLTKTEASETYITKADAADTYESKTDAATHLTKTEAANTYVTKAENNTKANDSDVVHKSGDETIAGTKTFSSQIKGNISGSSTSCTGNSASATKLATARTISLTGAVIGSTSFNGSANASINTTLSNIDASKITSGTIDLARIPKAAIPEFKIVADDTARFALTTSDIQNGDTVQVTSTGKMYYVKDQTKLSSEAGYAVYTAGAASSVPWSGVTGKPSSYTPAVHTQAASTITGLATVATSGSYTDLSNKPTIPVIDSALSSTSTNGLQNKVIKTALDGKANSSHTHTKSQITDFPALATVATSGSYNDLTNKPAIPTVNNATLTIQKNGTTVKTFTANASANVTANITVPTKVSELTNDSGFLTGVSWNSVSGKPATFAPSSHTHDDRYYTETEVNNLLKGKANDNAVVHLTGDETIAGIKTFNDIVHANGFHSTAANAFMAQCGSYTFLIRNDSSSTYLLMSDKDGVPGTWSNARPLTISNSTGVCNINGNAATATTATTAKACTGNSATATKATQDSAGHQIDTTYIKGLAVSGRTITYTKGDNTTGTITTQDTNTWTAFKGATSSANGTAGYVPAPTKGNQDKFFKADGTWATPPNTTYASMSASEATTGTATAARTISAKVLHDKINSSLSAYAPSSHTHDDRYYTETEVNNLLKGKANSSHTHPYIPTSASCNKNWNWSGRSGQPSWLWGSEDGTNMYIYNPSDFRVNYANSANSAVTAANGVDSYGDDWVRFKNGIQICWAAIPCGTSGASSWTYGASFSSRPVITASDQGSTGRLVYLTRAADIGTTSCFIVMVNESAGSYMSGIAQCIAIGKWK